MHVIATKEQPVHVCNVCMHELYAKSVSFPTWQCTPSVLQKSS